MMSNNKKNVKNENKSSMYEIKIFLKRKLKGLRGKSSARTRNEERNRIIIKTNLIILVIFFIICM
jgi:hypothetical protein